MQLPTRAPEAAAEDGLRYQKLVFMCEALKMLKQENCQPGYPCIESVQISSPDCRGIDDVVVYYAPPGRRDSPSEVYNHITIDYFQCKYHVESKEYGLNDLIELTKGTWWISWKKVYGEWVKERADSNQLPAPYLVWLITSGRWAVSELPLRHNSIITDKIFSNQKDYVEKRENWKNALGVSSAEDEEAFKALVNALRIKENQSESALLNDLDSSCRHIGLRPVNPNSGGNPYVDLATKLLGEKGVKARSPQEQSSNHHIGRSTLTRESLLQRLEDADLIKVKFLIPDPRPRQVDLPKSSFDKLKDLYSGVQDDILSVCFRFAFKEAFSGYLLSEVFPGLQSKLNWNLIEDYFFSGQVHALLDLDHWIRLMSALESSLSSPPKNNQPIISLLVYSDHGPAGLYQCSAVLKTEGKGFEKIRIPEISVVNPKSKESISIHPFAPVPIECLAQWIQKLILCLQYDPKIPSLFDQCLLDLYLPFDLLDMEWLVASDLITSPGEIILNKISYRVRSYDRWTKDDLLWSRKFLKEKWMHHDKGKDARAVVFRTEIIDTSPFDQFLRDESCLAICIKSQPSRESIERLQRHFVKSSVPIVTWWHYALNTSPQDVNRFFDFLFPAQFADKVENFSREILKPKLPEVVKKQADCWPNLVVFYEDPLDCYERDPGRSVLNEPKLFRVALGPVPGDSG